MTFRQSSKLIKRIIDALEPLRLFVNNTAACGMLETVNRKIHVTSIANDRLDCCERL